MAQIEFNEELAEQLEKIYAARDIVRRRGLVREALAAQPGERILDVGCGPGFYVAEVLDEVGPEGSVVGVDASDAMLAVASRRCEGRANVDLRQGDATQLPVEDGEFDAAISVQVLEYVQDVPAALRELRRAVRDGGRVAIWDVDWSTLSIHTEDEDRMARVLKAWDDHLADPWLPRTLTRDLRTSGFDDVRCEGHTFATNEFTPEAYTAALVPLVRKYVGDEGTLPDAELDAWVAEQGELAERGEFFAACIQFCFTAVAAPAAGGQA